MINSDITVRGSNNRMIKALIISSLIMGLLMGVLFSHLAYGEYELSPSQEERITSHNSTHTSFECLNSDKEFTIQLDNVLLDDQYFRMIEDFSCIEYDNPSDRLRALSNNLGNINIP